jgi:sugar/nucleoside kinase (ribokinase family)
MMINKEKLPSVLGVGNALTDILFRLEEDTLLKTFGLPRGSMTLVDASLSKKIFDTVDGKYEISTGGSAANTIRSLAGLGGNCGYLGKVGDDQLGRIFKQEFEKQGIKTHLALSEKETGRVMALVSNDSERTMATYLGAAADLTPDDFSKPLFSGYHYLYMEGYLVQNHELIKTGFELAKSAGLKTAIDLASFNVVEANLAFLKELVYNTVDIVFANEEESHAFTGKSPEKALNEIAGMCELAIVKLGRDGSVIKRGNEKVKTGVFKANAIDTTGAGDSYAAGFLYGLTSGFDLEKCGKIAALVSSKVVEIMGANLPDTAWEEINTKIEKM